MHKNLMVFFACSFFFVGIATTQSHAQGLGGDIPADQIVSLGQGEFDIDVYRKELSTVVANPRTIKTLFFKEREHALLQDARSGLSVIVPEELQEEQKLQAVQREEEEAQSKIEVVRPKGLREISLAGILYVSGQDWTLWLNGQRVTPKAIPKEIKQLKVYKDYVEIQWFDAYTNQIFPIRCHP